MATVTKRRETTTIVDVRFLVISAIAAASFLAIAIVWNRFQVTQMAGHLLEQADRFAEQESWRDALDYISQYRQLRPDDGRARIRQAEIYDRVATTPAEKVRAVSLYDLALAAAAENERPKLLERQAELQLEVAVSDPRRFAVAAKQAWQVLGLPPGDMAALEKVTAEQYSPLRVLALALVYQAELGGDVAPEMAVQACELALRHQPADLEVLHAAVGLYRLRISQPEKADALIQGMLTHLCGRPLQGADQGTEIARLVQQTNAPARVRMRGADSSQHPHVAALLLAYEYGQRFDTSDADRYLDAAIEAAPADFAASLAAGLRAVRRSSDETRNSEARDQAATDAVQFLQAASAAAPARAESYLLLAAFHGQQGNLSDAIACLRGGIKNVQGDAWSLNVVLMEMLLSSAQAASDAPLRLQQLQQAEAALRSLQTNSGLAADLQTAEARLFRATTRSLLEGRLLLARGNAVEAAKVLVPVATQQVGGGADASQAQQKVQGLLLLSECYGRLGRWDQAAMACENALELQPGEFSHRLAAAAARNAAGQYAAAVQHLQIALNAVPAGPQPLPAWAPSAAMSLAQNQWQALPAEIASASPYQKQVLISELQQTLEQAERWNPGAAPLAILKAQILISPLLANPEQDAATRRERAIELVRGVESQEPPSPEMWNTLALAYEQLGLTEDADRALNRWAALAPDGFAAALRRAEWLLARKQADQAQQALDALSRNPDLSEAQRLTVGQLQVQILLQQTAGDPDQTAALREAAVRQLAELSERIPANLSLLEQLHDQYLKAEAWTSAEACEDRMRQVEGAAGTQWRYARAVRLLGQFPENNAGTLNELKTLQAAVEAARPNWSGAHVLKALVASREGQADQMLAALQRALALGDRSSFVLRMLMELHNDRGEFVKAKEYLAQLEAAQPERNDLLPERISVALGMSDWAEAENAARQQLEAQPDEPGSYIMLSRILYRTGRVEEAEQVLRDAQQRLPQDDEIWKAVFSFETAENRLDDARQTLDQFIDTVPLEPAERDWLLAQGKEMLLETAEARRLFRQAASAAPDNAEILDSYAQFLLRNFPQDAKAELRELHRQSPVAVGVRRALAMVLAREGGRGNWEEIARLLSGATAEVEDRRLQAVLLTGTGIAENRRQARKLLEELARESISVPPGDRLLLAAIMESEGQTQLARDHYLALASTAQPDPSHIAAFVGFLLRQGEAAAASPWFDRLQELAGQTTDYRALRARWLKAMGREAEIEPLIEEFAQEALAQDRDPSEAATIHLQLAELYTSLGLPRQATRHLQQVATVMPESYSRLAISLAHQGDAEQAVRLCLERDPVHDVQACLTLCAVLMSDPDAEAAHELAEPTLQQALASHSTAAAPPSDAQVQALMFIASLRHVQGRMPESIQLNERILALRPQNTSLLNNLATVLAEQPGSEQKALALVQRAMDLEGETPNLVDTRGFILLQLGKLDEALECFAAATNQSSADPRYHFHRAVVHDRLGQSAQAERSFRQAVEANLEMQILTPVERNLWSALVAKYQ